MSKELPNEVKATLVDRGDHVDHDLKQAGAIAKFAADVWSRSDAARSITMDVATASKSIIELKPYNAEDEYAKSHLTKQEYEQYERESSFLYKLGYYLTGKDAKDEFPMHDRVKHDMAEDAKHNLNKDDEVAGVMFKNDPGKYKEYQKEKEAIEKFKKEHPHEDLDMKKYPQHRFVEDVIAATKPVLIMTSPYEFGATRDIRL